MAATTIKKEYISPDQLYVKSFKFAQNIYKTGFKPTWIIAIWRGGCPVGMCVQEYFKVHEVPTNHISVRTSSYTGIDQQSSEVRIHGLEYFVKTANREDRLLIIDDIFDSGKSVNALLTKIATDMRANTPDVIRIGTLYYKPHKSKLSLKPDYYQETTDKWVVFPHELEGLTWLEIEESKGDEIASFIEIDL